MRAPHRSRPGPDATTLCAPWVIVLVLVLAAPSTAQLLFEAPFVTYPVAGDGHLFVPSDLDGDGDVDLVVASGTFLGPNYLGVLLSAPGGGFTAHDLLQIETLPDAMELVDVDADGDQDLVTVHFRENWIRVYERTGTAEFRPAEPIPTVPAPGAITVGDVDLDGRMDLVVRPYWSDALGVHLALPGGGFAPPIAIPFEEFYALRSVIQDVTADGKPDLVLALRNWVAVWPGDGRGRFGAEIRAPVQGDDFVLADFDHDARPDLAVVTRISVVVLLGRAGGTFVVRAEYPTARYPESIAVAAGHLNRDDHLDLVVSNWQSHQIPIFLGRGDGSFAAGAVLSAPSPGRVSITDADGDGDADMVLASDGITVLHGSGEGDFGPRREFAAGGGSGHAVGDVDGDGRLDVVTANASSTVTLLRGQGDGTFSPREDTGVGGPAYTVALADLDADGRLDLTAGIGDYSQAEGVLTVLRGHGDGTFDPPRDFPVGPYPAVVRLADFDADGRLDAVVGTKNDMEGTGGMSVLLGTGDGSFASRHDYPTGACQDLVVTDLDADGVPDVVLVESWGNVRPFVGLGDGAFEPRQPYRMQRGAWSIGAGDFDHDGLVDLAVGLGVYQLTSSLDLLRGVGDGTFVPQGSYDVREPLSVAVADLDQDGFLDIAAGSSSWGPGTVTVLRGRGDGTFADDVGYGVGSSAKQVTCADVDGSGRVDLVVSNQFSYSISVLLSIRTVPVLVSGLSAEPRDGMVLLSWDFAPGSWDEAAAIHVARGRSDAGPFERLTRAPLAPEPHMTFTDQAPDHDALWYRIEVAARDGSLAVAGPVRALAEHPRRSALVAVASGPGRVRVRYALAARGALELNVYDARGRLVRTLFDGVQAAGAYTVDWNHGTDTGRAVARGIYFVRLNAPDAREARKVVLVRH